MSEAAARRPHDSPDCGCAPCCAFRSYAALAADKKLTTPKSIEALRDEAAKLRDEVRALEAALASGRDHLRQSMGAQTDLRTALSEVLAATGLTASGFAHAFPSTVAARLFARWGLTESVVPGSSIEPGSEPESHK